VSEFTLNVSPYHAEDESLNEVSTLSICSCEIITKFVSFGIGEKKKP
jgi:hypothetical protein